MTTDTDDTDTDTRLPRLRPLDIQPTVQDGRPMLFLRDPFLLSDNMVAVPRQLGPALALMDGTRDRAALRSSLIVQYQTLMSLGLIDQMIGVLDEALLLDNRRFREARRRVLAEYRSAPFRTPALAGKSYPDDLDQLRALLDGYLAKAGPDGSDGWAEGRGLLSPHIDFDPGGPVYAQVWKCAARAAQLAEVAVILGTDHYSEGRLITLTRQSYATPYGVLPTATGIVDALAEALGEEAAFAGELHHRGEHSIELASVWLHHMRGGRPIELVPVLTGSFAPYVSGEVDPESDAALNALVDTLRRALDGRRALIVSAGDLAHVGPAFGGEPMGIMERARLRVADEELLKRLAAGDARGFLQAIQRVQDRNNVCGLPPTYLALRILGEGVTGETVGYDRCPADAQNASFVSIGGVIFK